MRAALQDVLAALDLDDARAAYRAIARANPGGLGDAPEQDVHDEPTLGLREAMQLAATRDRIASQYARGFADLFELGLAQWPSGFALSSVVTGMPAGPMATQAVQRVFLGYLASGRDSHIVRKHGESLAHIVMSAAQGWQAVAVPDREAGFARWDEQLKAQAINPGTSADLTVATLFLGGLLASAWHGS